MTHRTARWTMLCALLATCASCGPGAQEGGGIGGTGIVASVSSGPVTGFGSVFVSGVEYDTTGASFVVDRNESARAQDLRLGMIVRVDALLEQEVATGRIVRRTAQRVTYADTVEGPLQALDTNGRLLTVMGQSIVVTDDTFLDVSIPQGDFHLLETGHDILEISGFVGDDGRVIATRIDRQQDRPEFEVLGHVTQVDPVAQTLRIGALLIAYDRADVSRMPLLNPSPARNGATGTTAWDNLLVRAVGGTYHAPTAADPVGRFDTLRLEPDVLGVQTKTRAEIEGFVGRILSPTSFSIGAYQVTFDETTTFEGGTARDLGEGLRLEVSGTVEGTAIRAQRIEFSDHVKLEARIDAIATDDGVSGTVRLVGLPNTTVQVSAATGLKGLGAPTRLGDLRVGDYVVIRGESSGTIAIAGEISRQTDSRTVMMQGPIGTVRLSPTASPILTILGSELDTSPLLDGMFRGPDDRVIGRAAFAAQAQPGRLVELEGTATGTTIDWLEAELQQ
ncbi:MAG: DUF5666 domain-containing protein [Nitrospiraceae bacterium]